jgi:hypothetical protein
MLVDFNIKLLQESVFQDPCACIFLSSHMIRTPAHHQITGIDTIQALTVLRSPNPGIFLILEREVNPATLLYGSKKVMVSRRQKVDPI